ncbi:uncharacterized protein LOC117580441 [Drosophila guanche]|uniref:Uncharacterized protein n=1 Tax=Drosophila guanche TaxID=7266 RepID=A0A3B0J8W3_DROGU|nr:uncharacterized protein LOC117580441 [Drosophila guanche]SPP76332.1 Hypothetical predicted protein [Drosophila guanche]
MILKILLLLLLVEANHGIRTSNYNDGECSYIEKIRLMRICKATVSKRIAGLYGDIRAPSGTPYSLWVVPNETDMILASFHTSPMLNRKYIEIIKYKIDVDLKHSDLHCLADYNVYNSHLLAHCKRKKFVHGTICTRPVLHYAREGPKREDSDSAFRFRGDWLPPLLLTILLIRVWAIIGIVH